MKVEKIIFDEKKNTSLTCYIQDVEGEFAVKERPAVLIIPGGGYSYCSDREADPIAFKFLDRGYQAFILRYSCDHIWPNPLNDYEKAMEIIKTRTDFHVANNKIAVCGFSAGGHLAAAAATQAKNRPNVAIIGYGSLTKEIIDAMCVKDIPYPVEHVDNKTCPCFVFCSRDDTIVNAQNTLLFSKALEEKHINFETRVYAFGNHAFSSGSPVLCVDTIPEAEARWMEDALLFCEYVLGKFTPKGFDKPKLSRCYLDDGEEYLSLNCSIAHFIKHRDAFIKDLPEIYQAIDAITAKFNGVLDVMALGNLQASVLVATLNLPNEKVEEIKERTSKIKNVSE